MTKDADISAESSSKKPGVKLREETMDFEIRAIFKRSFTLELCNDSICYTEPFEVYVNGELRLQDTRNVVSIGGLQPDTEYTVRLCQHGQACERRIRTAYESVLLNVRCFGAHGDGVTDDTAYLQAAISACPKDGTVLVPEGVYLTRPLFLKSHMTLWIDRGATLLGDADRAHYPIMPGTTPTTDGQGEYNLASWEGNPEHAFAALISGYDLEQLDIVGEGTVDGNADKGDWWENPKEMRTAWRPRLMFLCRCRHVRIQSLHVKNSPSWTVHPYYTDHIALYNVDIWNPSDSPNTDGFDPESCDDVLVLGTRISVGDDCIAIKSGKIYMSTHHRKPAEHFVIRNSFLERGHGSVTVGSEAAGGVSNVEVSRCIFDSTDRGLRIKTRRGRGPHTLYDGIYFHDIIMRGVHMPITLNMFYFCDPDGHTDYVQNQQALPVDERTPTIGTIKAENMVCTGTDACFVCAYGLPENYIRRLELRNIDVSFLPKQQRRPRQTIMMDNFPDMSGVALYIRNIDRLILDRVSIHGSDDKEPTRQDVREYECSQLVFDDEPAF